MLRRQSPDFDKLSFLSGHSAMAKRIRDFDWSTHPLGPPDTWSAALRSALGIALNSAFPTCIYWGPELRLLYNDSWSLIPGPRHPGCLGEPAEEVWSDIWHVIEPQFARAITKGEGVYFRDQMLPMRRFGVEEETYWTYNFTPIRDDDGSIRGVFNSGNETTRQVMQQAHTRFLLELSDVYRTMGDVDAVRGRSLEMLGRHLEVDRVGLREQRHSDPEHALPIVEQWCAEGVEPVPAARGQVPIDNSAWAELLLGRVVRIDGSTPGREEVERKVLDQIGCASALAVPWVTEGRTEAILFAHSFTPRHWTDLEVETVEAVLSRMMTLMERTRAIARERLMSREINHRARNLLSVAQAMIYPAFIMVFATIVIMLMMTFVVPKLVAVFEGRDQTLPLLTRIVMALSDFARDWGWLLLLVVVVAVVAFMRAMRDPGFRLRVHRKMVTMPMVGTMLRAADSARLASTLGILGRSGVPLVDALFIAAQVVGNLEVRNAVKNAAAKVREGGSLSRALDASGYFPPMLVQMIASGEASGELDHMLTRAADYQERELSSTVNTMVGLLGPIMLLFMAGVVVLIVLSVMLPIMQMNNLLAG